MMSLGWTLIQYDWCPYKKEKFGCRERYHIGPYEEREYGCSQREHGYLEATERALEQSFSLQP